MLPGGPCEAATGGEIAEYPERASSNDSKVALIFAFLFPTIPKNPDVFSEMISMFSFSLETWNSLQAFSMASSIVFPSISNDFILIASLISGCLFVDVVLLPDTDDIVEQPVDDQPRREIQKHDRKNYRHEKHYFCLHRIAGGGCHFLLEEHCSTHNNWGNVIGIFCRQVLYPPDERGMPQLDRIKKSFIKAEKDRDLYYHGKASAHRIHFVGFVKGHHFLAYASLVILILFAQFGHFGLKFLHLFHGLVA